MLFPFHRNKILFTLCLYLFLLSNLVLTNELRHDSNS